MNDTSTRSRDLLDRIGGTPLVALRKLPREHGCRVDVLVKCEHLNPGGSVKDRVARAIVDDAESRGLLRPGDATIVEATAGNTGIGLALVGAARGYRVVCVMPEKMAVEKRRALRLLGVEVVVTPNAPPSDPNNFQNVAERMAREHGWFLADQFRNPANVAVHEQQTARELLEQTGGRIGAFVAGAGTGGTITGVGRRLKRHCPDVRIVLADPVGSGLADWVTSGTVGPSADYLVEGIGSSQPPANLDRSVIDEALRIPDEQSFETARRCIRDEGLLLGGSAGTNIAAALQVATRNDLDGPVVTIGCDSWDRYRAQPWLTNPDPTPEVPAR
ncbi:MAG: PLP-dependent cysteine synthase family protein [Planctomycetota bacterium]